MAAPLKKDTFGSFSKEKTTKGSTVSLIENFKGSKNPAAKPLGLLERYSLHKKDKTVEENESNWLISYADMMTLMVGFFILLQSFSKTDAAKFEQIKRSATKVFGGEYTLPYAMLSKKLKEVVKEQRLNNQVVFTELDDGLIVNFRGALFFDSGSYDLRGDAKALVDKIIPVITQYTKDMGIIVEGYTDNTPTNGVFSNWELSSLRACAVLKIFEAHGINREKLRAQGFGDAHPVVPNTDEKGVPIPANQAMNRRVVIKILRAFE